MLKKKICYYNHYEIEHGTTMLWKTIGLPEIKGQWKLPAQRSPCPQTCTTTVMVLNMHK